MKRRIGWIGLLVLTLLLGWFWRPVAAQLKYAALSVANIFTARQTFSGGVGLVGATTYLNDGTAELLPTVIDFTMTNPTVGVSGMTTGSIGSCTSAETYGLYWIEANQSGETGASPRTNYTPTGTTKQIQNVARPSPNALATHWRLLYSKLSEGHSTIRSCATPVTYTAIGTATLQCNCGSSNSIYTNANTTGPVTISSHRDGEIRYAADPASGTVSFQAAKNRVYAGQSVLRWSNDSGTTKVDVATWSTNEIRVCKAGCRYSTIAAGIAAITGNTTTNRFTVNIGPGDWDEDNLAVKPYVAFVGAGAQVTRIRGIPGNSISETFDFDNTTTENLFMNMTIGGLGPLQGTEASAGSGTRTIYVANVVLGITDGSENTDKTIDGYLFTGLRPTTIYETDSSCFSVYDCLRMGGSVGAPNRYFSTGSQYFMSGPYSGARSRVWSLTAASNEVYVSGFIVRATYADDYPVHLLDVNPQADNGTNRISLVAGDMYVESTSGSRTSMIACVDLSNIDSTIGTGTVATVDLTDVNCTITSASASGTLYGVKVTTDSDHDNWKVTWRGGKIALSGGATRYDVDSAETETGFELILNNVERSSSLNGAGTTYTNTNLAASACSAKCKVGMECVNTSPALCFCTAADTWTLVSGGGSCP